MIKVKSVNCLDSTFYEINGILEILDLHRGKTIDDNFIKEFNRLICNTNLKKKNENP